MPSEISAAGVARDKRHILVTGSPRSGTTFLGTMLSLPSDVGYVQEPFNCTLGMRDLDTYFHYFYEGMEDEAEHRARAARLLNGKAVFRRLPVAEGPTLWRKAGRLMCKSENNFIYLRARADPRVKRLLFKDPFACLASEYLHRQFGMQVVILIRHPAAFVTSMMRLGSPHHLADLTSQEGLMKHHLGDVLSHVRVDQLPTVEQLALSWLCLYQVMMKFLAENPAMILVRHEDLSNDPTNYLASLYGQLGLPFTPRIDRTIRRYTSLANPIEPTDNKPHVLKRNSRGNACRWKSVLTPNQARAIRGITLPIARDHYDEESWEVDVAEVPVNGQGRSGADRELR